MTKCIYIQMQRFLAQYIQQYHQVWGKNQGHSFIVAVFDMKSLNDSVSS